MSAPGGGYSGGSSPDGSTRYQSVLDWLFPRTTQIKFGLSSTRRLLAEVGDPDRQFDSIHIGGTNGKGSVATLVAAALAQHGVRVGLYTSPHLISFRERIRVDACPISNEAIVAWAERLRPLVEELGATFFEITTAIAFADFAARGVEVAVVEVGLGGRLDSTNVIDPLISAVTNIGIDHQKYLGDTIEQIAREKAGISKPAVPFVVGESDPRLADLLLQAADPESLPILVPRDRAWVGELGLAGEHQRRNAAVAEAILQQLPLPIEPGVETVRAAFAATRLAGRLERRGKWLYDVAHNPDGMRSLTEALTQMEGLGPIHALVSILGDKDWPGMLTELDRVIDFGILTVAPSALERGWDARWLEEWLADHSRPKAEAEWHLEPNFDAALARVEVGAGTILVTGSFHTVGDVLQARAAEVYFGP